MNIRKHYEANLAFPYHCRSVLTYSAGHNTAYQTKTDFGDFVNLLLHFVCWKNSAKITLFYQKYALE